jgi:hypothetical protein
MISEPKKTIVFSIQEKMNILAQVNANKEKRVALAARLGIVLSMLNFLFTGATNPCGSWPPPLCDSKFLQGGVVSPTPNPQHGGPGITLHLAPTL